MLWDCQILQSATPPRRLTYQSFLTLAKVTPSMNTLLVPIDFSDASQYVIAEAVVLARAAKSRLLLLHVVQPPVVVSDYGLLIENIAQLTVEAEKDASARLTQLKAKLVARGIPTEVMLRTGSPVFHILEQAKKKTVSHIVIGSHGHTAFFDLLIGSTASAVLKRADRPVLVVPIQSASKDKEPKKK